MTPIFIIGAGRSGTKFLRDLLSASPVIATVPYDVGYIWRHGNHGLTHDEFTPDMANQEIRNYIHHTLPTLAKGQGKDTRYFVEKSVPNTLRPAFLHTIYPNAKFIHLIRDGRAVTESSIRMWNAPTDLMYLLRKLQYFPVSSYKHALWYLKNTFLGGLATSGRTSIWGPRYNGIDSDLTDLPLETLCARQWRKSVETAQAQLITIPTIQVIEIRYENLMTDPSVIERLCHFLDIPSAEINESFKNMLDSSNINKWRETLEKRQLKNIEKEIGALLSNLDYH